MSGWALVAALALGTYALRAPGPLLAAAVRMPALAERLLAYVTPAVLAGLVVTATFAAGDRLVVDERAAGLAAAVLAIALRAPLLVTVIVAAAATAALRALA